MGKGPFGRSRVSRRAVRAAFGVAEPLESRTLLAGEVPTLVADILPAELGSAPASLTNVNGTLFFSADDPVNGRELWKSDGTSAGTVLVRDIRPGSAISYPSILTNVNGTLFFSANDGVNGNELWKSDGTSAGTVLVKDIRPGSTGSSPSYLTNVNGTLFFRADDGVNGNELWKSDGTAAGTVLVRDIRPGSATSYPSDLTTVNGTLFFRADDGVNGYELWKSDGTAAGTALVRDIRLGSTGSFPGDLTNVNGTLFFGANDGVNGKELWKSDGTAAGTVLVRDVRPGSLSSNPFYLTTVNGTLFFRADDGVDGNELRKSDGTAAGTVLVKDIRPGGTGSFPSNLTTVNGTLFFRADNGVNGNELWKSDGTAAGTVLVRDIRLGSAGSNPGDRTTVNGTLFFRADDGVNGYELWRSDGTAAGTVLVRDIRPGSLGSSPFFLTNINGTLFFRANEGAYGEELWKLSAPDTTQYLVTQGAEYRINTSWRGNQERPAVAVDASGNSMVVWRNNQWDSRGIFAQRYSADGARVGPELMVSISSVFGDDADAPVIAIDGGGIATIAYSKDGEIFSRRYNSSGVPLGAEVQVSSTPNASAKAPATDVDSAGNIVVTWESLDQDGSGAGIYARRYSPLGVPLASQFRVNTVTAGDQRAPAVAVDQTGNFMIVWESSGHGTTLDVYAQRYNGLGSIIGGEFRVNTNAFGDQRAPAVSVDSSGRFSVAWAGTSPFGGSQQDIFFRRYNSSGVALSGDIWVGEGSAAAPSIASDSFGNVVIAAENPYPSSPVFVWRYSQSGALVNYVAANSDYRDDEPQRPAVAVDTRGEVTVAWQSFRDGGWDVDIYASRLSPLTIADPNPGSVSGMVFEDANGNGLRDPGEAGRGGVTVTASHSLWSIQTTTASDGTYTLNGVLTGRDVWISLSVPDRILTREGVGTDDSIDSDFSASGSAGYVRLNLEPGQSVTRLDAGLVVPATARGLVYQDRNLNGTREADEPTIDSWLVYVDENGNGVHDSNETATWTTWQGEFSFGQLLPGAYVVRPAPRSGWNVLGSATATLSVGQTVSGLAIGNHTSARRPTTPFRVNSQTPGAQFDPVIAADQVGNFVAVWVGDDGGVYGRRFDRSGTPLGADLRVNSVGQGISGKPALAVDATGNFVVAWRSGDLGVFARRYTSGGVPAGAEFRVSLDNSAEAPAVAFDGQGNLIVVYESQSQWGPRAVYGRRFNVAGSPLGGEFLVSDSWSVWDPSPAVAADATGRFVVSWLLGTVVVARRFTAAGTAAGSSFVVNRPEDGLYVYNPRIGVSADGTIFAVWEESGYSSSSILGRRFSSSGAAVTEQFLVSTTGSNGQPALAVSGDGAAIVSWASWTGQSSRMMARRFDAFGGAVDGEFALVAVPGASPSVALDGSGNFVAAYAAAGDGGGDVFATVARMPRVSSVTLLYDLPTPRVEVVFDQDVGASLAPDDFSIIRRGVGTVATSVLAVTYNPAERKASVTFPGLLSQGALPDGNYEFSVRADNVFNSDGVQLSDPAKFTFHALGGDATRDRVVDIADFARLATRFNRAGSFGDGDFTFDGLVGIADFSILAASWQRRVAPFGEVVLLSGGVEIFGSSTDRFGQAPEPTAVGRSAMPRTKQFQGGGSTSTGVVEGSLSFSVTANDTGVTLMGRGSVVAPDPSDPADFASIGAFTGENNVGGFNGAPVRFELVADGPVPYSIQNANEGATTAITPVTGQFVDGAMLPGIYEISFFLAATISNGSAVAQTLDWRLLFGEQVGLVEPFLDRSSGTARVPALATRSVGDSLGGSSSNRSMHWPRPRSPLGRVTAAVASARPSRALWSEVELEQPSP